MSPEQPTDNPELGEAGRIIAALPRPLSRAELDVLVNSVHHVLMHEHGMEAVAGTIMPTLQRHGATFEQVDIVARSAVFAYEAGKANGMRLGRCKQMLSAVWRGSAMTHYNAVRRTLRRSGITGTEE